MIKQPSQDSFFMDSEYDDSQNMVITGSRDIPRNIARSLFDKHLLQWIGLKRKWMIGGARGIDHWATEWLLEKTESCQIVVPFSVADQPKEVQSILSLANNVTELHLPHSKAAYIKRNQFMVDRCTVVIGFWSGKAGGTMSTIQYALSKRREIHVYLVGFIGKSNKSRLP